jgi:hypothetical protein
MPSLFDPKLKLAWAKKHLDLLGEKIAAFRKNNKGSLSAEEDAANGWYVIRIHIPHDDSTFDIALVAGDFISNLRACLDHLAWQLALHTTDNPSREICFPICEKNSIDTQVRIVKSTFGIPEAAIATMKEMQPYLGGDNYKLSHLWRLHKLWNLDKHRHITPHGVVTNWLFKIEGIANPLAQFGVEELDDGCVMKVPLAIKDKVQFNPNPSGVDVRLIDRAEGIDLGYGDLLEIYEFVAKIVIPAFAVFFPEDKKIGESSHPKI